MHANRPSHLLRLSFMGPDPPVAKLVARFGSADAATRPQPLRDAAELTDILRPNGRPILSLGAILPPDRELQDVIDHMEPGPHRF